MQITFNNLTSSKDIICLSGVPNIVTFTGSSTTRTYAEYQFAYQNIINIDINKQYNINFGDYNITSTFDDANVGGTTFWLPQFNSYENHLYSCHTIVRAFRNVPFIAANYNVWLDDADEGSMSPMVYIKAKREGALFNVNISSDLPENTYVWTRIYDGGTNDVMLQGKANKIICDIYKYRIPSRFGTTNNGERDYVTSLEKNYYGKPVSFDVTPVLNTMLSDDNYEDVQQFNFDLYGFSDKKMVFSQQSSQMYITNGYLCNFSQPFINSVYGNFLAANVSRGDERIQYNNTYLYTYYPSITFSVYTSTYGFVSGYVNYYDSADNQIASIEHEVVKTEGDTLKTYTIALDTTQFSKSSYIDFFLPAVGRIRYNVIKPINATDETEVRRVYWYNEYNGVSFFDFTGDRSETRKENLEYYEKQNFDFYNAENAREKNRVYDKTIDIEVKHSSHYIDKNGIYLFYSLQNSKRAWVELSGIKYYINVTNLEISESNNTSHIYTARITYEYSEPDLS